MSGLLQQAGDLSLVDLEGSDGEPERSQTLDTAASRRVCRVTPGAEEALNCLSKSQIFHGVPLSTMSRLLDDLFVVRFRAGQVILQQGTPVTDGDCMFVLRKGKVDVEATGTDLLIHKESNGGTSPGWLFGETAVLFKDSRTATIRARTDVKCWALERRALLAAAEVMPSIRKLSFLRKLPSLQVIPSVRLVEAGQTMTEEVYDPGEYLIRQGEVSDCLYIIRRGVVKICRPTIQDGASTEVARLSRGRFLGHRTLGDSRVRSADCIAETKVSVLRMDATALQSLDNPWLSALFDYEAMLTVVSNFMQAENVKRHLEDFRVECVAPKSVTKFPEQHVVIVCSGKIEQETSSVGGYAYTVTDSVQASACACRLIVCAISLLQPHLHSVNTNH